VLLSLNLSIAHDLSSGVRNFASAGLLSKNMLRCGGALRLSSSAPRFSHEILAHQRNSQDERRSQHGDQPGDEEQDLINV
jgi:hypothetical protein